MADLVVPELGESLTEATIGKWLKDVGERVEADEPLVDLETDKVTVQISAPAAGVIAERRADVGDTVAVGDVIGLFVEGGAGAAYAAGEDGEDGEPSAQAGRDGDAPAESTAMSETGMPAAAAARRVRASRAASHKAPSKTDPELAKRQPAEPAGNGDSGWRLTPSQRRAVREGHAPQPAERAPRAAAKQPAAPVEAKPGEEVVAMTPLRKRIAERLVEAQQTAAILTTFNEVDVSRVMALRAEHKEAFLEAHGVKLGFMSFFIKASIAALKDFPGLNAEVRGESIVYKKFYNVGIAVGGGKGLVVPVLRDVDKLSFAEIEAAIVEYGQKAQKNTLKLDELMGGTFTISNGGVYGSMMSTPLLNFPQTGILGMHNIVERPVVIDGAVQVRPMMYVALSYDHRVVDGREAVQFLVGVKRRIEQPDRLMFDL